MTVEHSALEVRAPLVGPGEPDLDDNAQAAEPAARVPKYYRLKRHLLEMTQTMPPGTPRTITPSRSSGCARCTAATGTSSWHA